MMAVTAVVIMVAAMMEVGTAATTDKKLEQTSRV